MEVFWDSLMVAEIEKILRITSLKPRSTAKNGRNFRGRCGIFITRRVSKDLVGMLERRFKHWLGLVELEAGRGEGIELNDF